VFFFSEVVKEGEVGPDGVDLTEVVFFSEVVKEGEVGSDGVDLTEVVVGADVLIGVDLTGCVFFSEVGKEDSFGGTFLDFFSLLETASFSWANFITRFSRVSLPEGPDGWAKFILFGLGRSRVFWELFSQEFS